jgi:hypothetical protein
MSRGDSPIGRSQYCGNGPLQANPRRSEAEDLRLLIADKESMKPEATVTPVDSSNREVVDTCRCRLAWAAVLCCTLVGV